MKDILVVSDNFELIEHFQWVASKLDSNNVRIDYCFSANNSHPENLVSLGMKSFDMNSGSHIDSAIEKYNLIFSVHCKQLFPKKLVESVVCINVHPGLNPYNRGWYPQVFSIVNKMPAGCTIHLMDEEIDHGDIIYQTEVAVNEVDTSREVYNRIIDAEKALIAAHLQDLIDGNYATQKPSMDGNYNGIEDFKTLCKLDLDHVGSLREHINLLRGLSHDGFKNGYFMTDDNKKVYVSLSLEATSSGD